MNSDNFDLTISTKTNHFIPLTVVLWLKELLRSYVFHGAFSVYYVVRKAVYLSVLLTHTTE